MAKTKITPIKGSTIPRLELAATLTLARLAEKIAKKLDLPWGESYSVVGLHHRLAVVGEAAHLLENICRR